MPGSHRRDRVKVRVSERVPLPGPAGAAGKGGVHPRSLAGSPQSRKLTPPKAPFADSNLRGITVWTVAARQDTWVATVRKLMRNG